VTSHCDITGESLTSQTSCRFLTRQGRFGEETGHDDEADVGFEETREDVLHNAEDHVVGKVKLLAAPVAKLQMGRREDGALIINHECGELLLFGDEVRAPARGGLGSQHRGEPALQVQWQQVEDNLKELGQACLERR
jgi:hypothetical protein